MSDTADDQETTQMSCTDGNGGGRNGGSTRRMMGSTLLLHLAQSEVFSAASLVGASAFDEYVLTGGDFEGLGPSIVDIVVHAEGSNFTNSFTYDVVLQYKYNLGNWLLGSNLLTLRNVGDYVIGNPVTNRQNFGMRTRIVLRTQSSGLAAAGPQRGNLSIAAAVRLYTGS